MAQIEILFLNKTAKNHTIWGRAYMYLQSPYKGIPPWDSNVSPTLDSIYFMVDDKNSVTNGNLLAAFS